MFLKYSFKIFLFLSIIASFFYGVSPIENLNEMIFINSFFILIMALSFNIIFLGNINVLKIKNTKYIYLYFSLLLLVLLIPTFNFLTKLSEYLLKDISFIDKKTQEFESTMISIRENSFIYNMLLIALLPALGEEILFRGTLQNLISKKINIHTSIVITSIIFSIIHFNYKSIIPIFLISIIIGYSFHYSKSLLVPIIIHFINNLVSLITLYYQKELFFETTETNIYIVLTSLCLSVGSVIFLKKLKFI